MPRLDNRKNSQHFVKNKKKDTFERHKFKTKKQISNFQASNVIYLRSIWASKIKIIFLKHSPIEPYFHRGFSTAFI